MKYNKEILIYKNNSFTKDNFVFFWGHHKGKNGVSKSCFSQWYPCLFTVDGQQYNCAEQYMMAQKANVFGDKEVMRQILAETDQMTIKKLGRLVKNYDDGIWTEKRFQIVVEGNLAKFSQNDNLRNFLLNTDDKILVEASPKDTIWGIGFDEFAPEVTNPSLWNGENLLGFALMEIRDRLREIETLYNEQ